MIWSEHHKLCYDYNPVNVMNLSFVPGDLHLSKNSEGFFVLTMAGQEILKTRSERFAVAKFRSLRASLEKQFPAPESTPAEKAELLQQKIHESVLQRRGFVREKKTIAGRNARISTDALSEIQNALREYYAAVETSELSESSQATYIDMADCFVRWLTGDFIPGSRKAPYRVLKDALSRQRVKKTDSGQ